MTDYHHHLDTALVWWEMDEAVLEAIAHSHAENRSHRLLAGYVLQLRRTSPLAPGKAYELEAIAKIAERLSNEPVPDVSRFPRRRSAMPRVLTVAAAALVLLCLALIVGYSTQLIDAPKPVRDLLRKFGVDPEPAPERDGSIPAPDEVIEAAPVKVPQQGGGRLPQGAQPAARGSKEAPAHPKKRPPQQARQAASPGNAGKKDPPPTSKRDFGLTRRPEKTKKPPRPTPTDRPTPKGGKPPD